MAVTLNRTLVLREPWDDLLPTMPFNVSYDIPYMRRQHLTNPLLGNTFAWITEFERAAQISDLQHSCEPISVPGRSHPKQRLHQFMNLVRTMNSKITSRCAVIPRIMDGSTGWELVTSGCSKFPACSALYSSF